MRGDYCHDRIEHSLYKGASRGKDERYIGSEGELEKHRVRVSSDAFEVR